MQTPSVPAPPTPPAPSIRDIANGVNGSQVRITGLPQSPTAIYRGFVEQRRELRNQLEQAQDTRSELSNQLQGPIGGADRHGVEQHIAEVDARITSLDKQLAAADAQVAQAAAIPGAVVPDPPRQRNGPPEEVFFLAGMFIVIVMLPLSIALARRIWRRSSAAVAALPHDLMERLTRLDQAVDSIAVEVERIGEGQRFMTRVLAEKPAADALLAGPARTGQGSHEERSPRR